MTQLIPAAATAVAGTFAVSGTATYVAIYAATYVALTAAVTVGLNSLVQGQIPDPETGKQSIRQPRPQRLVLMGAPSRGGPAYMGSARA